MSTALGRFERTLVDTSRRLTAASGEQAAVPREAPLRAQRGAGQQVARRLRPVRRLRSLSLVAQLTVALVSLSVCAGVAVAAYAVFAGGAARELPAFECETAPNVTTIIPAVTGNPLIDCAASWPSASGGREAAPPLAIWGANDGQRLVAVAGPVSAGPPAGGGHFGWRRLPDSWTVDLPVVALNDQLNNISLPFTPTVSNACTFPGPDIAAVRSLLAADGLDDWSVTVRGQNEPASTGCRDVFAADVDAQHRTVELMQAPPQPNSTPTTTAGTTATTAANTSIPSTAPTTDTVPTDATTPSTTTSTVGSPTAADSYQQSLMRDAQLARTQLEQLYTTVNATLSANCESVADAAALWIQAAGADGFTPTTLAFWRQANAGQKLVPSTFPHHYTLYEQPASQDTGNCAHVLVMVVPGSGLANVYAARIAP